MQSNSVYWLMLYLPVFIKTGRISVLEVFLDEMRIHSAWWKMSHILNI